MAHQLDTHLEFGGAKKTLPAYLIGFLLSLILTLIAFGLVETRLLQGTALYTSLILLAFIQFLVQSVCFLRLNCSSVAGRWNLFPFLFALFIIAIFIGGSMWIMYNLNWNMMN